MLELVNVIKKPDCPMHIKAAIVMTLGYFISPIDSKNPLAKIIQFARIIKLLDYHLYSGDEAVERARSKLGQGGYNLALNNCEHFAVWCRTGVKDSSQVNNILNIITRFLD